MHAIEQLQADRCLLSDGPSHAPSNLSLKCDRNSKSCKVLWQKMNCPIQEGLLSPFRVIFCRLDGLCTGLPLQLSQGQTINASQAHPVLWMRRVSAVRVRMLRSREEKGADAVKLSVTKPGPTVTSAAGDGTNTPDSASKGRDTWTHTKCTSLTAHVASHISLLH